MSTAIVTKPSTDSTHFGGNAPWRQVAERRRLELDGDLTRVASQRASTDPRKEEVARLQKCLADASNIIHEQHGTLPRWWTGSSIEATWSLLREVEEGIVFLSPDGKVAAETVADHAIAYLAADDRALKMLRSTIAAEDPHEVLLPERAIAVLRRAHAASDAMHQEARSFRNRLLVTSMIVFVAMVGLCFIQWRARTFRLIPIPGGAATGTTSAATANYTDIQPWVLLGLVMAFGSLGALATSISTLSKVPRGHSPFNLPLQQTLLKITVGALTSTLGIMLLASDQVTSGFGSLQVLLAMAVALGAGQQAVTRFADKRAKALLSPASSGGDEGQDDATAS